MTEKRVPVWIYSNGSFNGEVYEGGGMSFEGKAICQSNFTWEISQPDRSRCVGQADTFEKAQEQVKLHVDEYAEPAKHPHIWIQFSGVFAPEDGENIIQMIRDGLKRKPKTCGAFWGYKRFGYEKDGVKDADSHNCEEA